MNQNEKINSAKISKEINEKVIQVTENIEAQKEAKKKGNLLSDFAEFIKKYGVIGLAIGVVIGQAVTKLVNSLVDNLVNPLLAKLIGQVDLSNFKPFDIKIGTFITDLINFLVITFVVYLAIRLFISNFLGEDEKVKLNLVDKK